MWPNLTGSDQIWYLKWFQTPYPSPGMNWLSFSQRSWPGTSSVGLPLCLFFTDMGTNSVVGKLWSQDKLSPVNEGMLHSTHWCTGIRPPYAERLSAGSGILTASPQPYRAGDWFTHTSCSSSEHSLVRCSFGWWSLAGCLSQAALFWNCSIP